MASAIRLCPRARRGSAFKSPPNIPRRISISLWSSLLQLKTNSVFRLPRHWEPKFPRPSASRFGPYCFYLRDSFPSLSAYIAENLRLFKNLRIRAKKEPRTFLSKMRGKYLATTYSHRTYRPTTIGAAAFHFRVRNGTGWFHCALVTRIQLCPSFPCFPRVLVKPAVLVNLAFLINAEFLKI